MTIRRIDPGSLARVLGIIYALLGLIGGVVFALLGSFGVGRAMPGMGGMGSGLGLAVVAIVLFPILYGVLGWVGGWIVAGLYNWVARRFGGIVLDTQ